MNSLNTKTSDNKKDIIEKAKEILVQLHHPFIGGLLGFLMVSYFLKNTTDLWFYLSLFFYILILPKIFIEFFLFKDTATENINKFIFKIALYYIIFSFSTDVLFYKKMYLSFQL